MKYLHSYASLDAFKAEAGSLPVPQVVVTQDGTTKYVSYKAATAASFSSHKQGEAAIVDILSDAGDTTHGGIVAKFNLTGGDGNTIGGASLYDALQTLYVDGSVFDIDDLVVTAGAGSASGSGSGANVGGIALPDTLSGEHTVEFVVSDDFRYRNTEKNGTFSGCNVVGDVACPTAYMLNANGYEYVDLGLSSGTLWATCNVGATSAEGYGSFFMWGDTTPHGHDDSYNYAWTNYKYAASTNPTFSKYNSQSSYGTVDNLTELELTDDAARVNLGGDWLMPTKKQIQELLKETTATWTTENGVSGRKFTGTNGNSIFIPAAGNRNGTNLNNVSSNCYLWSRSLNTSIPNIAFNLYFNSDNQDLYSNGRCSGCSVRGVL